MKKITLVKGDITQQKVEAIVNSLQSRLTVILTKSGLYNLTIQLYRFLVEARNDIKL
jgi:O-acetyl-ADP-ribose deacetylase (regulator of RNase III)